MTSDSGVANSARVIVIAVAPQHLRGLGNELRKEIGVGGKQGDKKGKNTPNKCMVVSVVAGVSAQKLSKLLGLTTVVRTFVDVIQLPVDWGEKQEGEQQEGEKRGRGRGGRGSVYSGDEINVAAKNLIAETGGPLMFVQAAVESLCCDLGVAKRDAKRESVATVVGDGTVGDGDGSPVKQMKEGSTREGREVDKEHPFYDLAGALKEWKLGGVAGGFHKVFAEEVLAKDLPSFQDKRQSMASIGDWEEEDEEEEEEEEEEKGGGEREGRLQD